VNYTHRHIDIPHRQTIDCRIYNTGRTYLICLTVSLFKVISHYIRDFNDGLSNNFKDHRAQQAKQATMKKALGETRTLRAGCSKAEPKILAPPQTPSPGRRTAKF